MQGVDKLDGLKLPDAASSSACSFFFLFVLRLRRCAASDFFFFLLFVCLWEWGGQVGVGGVQVGVGGVQVLSGFLPVLDALAFPPLVLVTRAFSLAALDFFFFFV